MLSERREIPRAHTETLGVVGHPVGHSLSPLLQNTLLSHFGLDACYHAFDVDPAIFSTAIRGAAALGFRGLNVTVPHKQRAAELCDELSPEATVLRAVNTLSFRPDGTVFGANTDPYGFRTALRRFDLDLPESGALVLGAGGAARSVVFALGQLRARTIWVANRTESRAQSLVDALSPVMPEGVRVYALPLTASAVQKPLEHCALVVNATSVGMSPHTGVSPLPPGARFAPGTAVMDLVYNPLKTLFLREAEEAGCEVQNGLDMLIHQAVASLEIWFNKKLEVDPEFLHKLRELLVDALSAG